MSMSTIDLSQFKQQILSFLSSKQVDPITIEHVSSLILPMNNEYLYLFCEFSFILKRRECDSVKKTGEHAIRDHLQTFWHDENRLVKDLRYSDYIHYFNKYHRSHELFLFFKLCTEHGNRKKPLNYSIKLNEFMNTEIDVLRSRSERKTNKTSISNKSSPKPIVKRTSGIKRTIKQEDTSIPCDLEYIPSVKKMRVMKSETLPSYQYDSNTSSPSNDNIDLFATEFHIDDTWSPISHSSYEYQNDIYSSPDLSPINEPNEVDNILPPLNMNHYEQKYNTNQVVPLPIPSYISYQQPQQQSTNIMTAAIPPFQRIPSLNSTELCASDTTAVDWEAITQDLNKTYQPIVESYYQHSNTYTPTITQGWFAPPIYTTNNNTNALSSY